VRRRWTAVLCTLSIACSRTPPSPEVPAAEEQITGRESIGWDQRAADPVELATFRYAIYVDGNRSELSGARCATSSSNGAYACSARLPSLSVGRHAIQIASFVVDGSILESSRSATLNVIVSGASSPSLTGAAEARVEWRTDPIVTADGVEMRIEAIARGFDRPSGLAFLPDRRIVVTEQRGVIRVLDRDGVASGRSSVDDVNADDGGLLAIALDPRFADNHFAYILYTARLRDDAAVFCVARVREAAGTFADRVVLHEDPRNAATATAALSIGPDEKLYVAVGRQVLRLNRDGTTPDDQPGHSPAYSAGYRAARGLAWQPQSGLLWVLDGIDPSTATVMAAGRPHTSRALPQSTPPSSMAFGADALRDDLVIASEAGRHLLRVRFDPRAPTTIVSTERLLQDAVGGIRVAAAGPDAALYFATADSVGRLVTVSRR
jgi:glucose/arabinose dehydrogenase